MSTPKTPSILSPSTPTPSTPTTRTGAPAQVSVYRFTVHRISTAQNNPSAGDLIDVVAQTQDDATSVLEQIYGDDLGLVEGGSNLIQAAFLSPNITAPQVPASSKN